MAKITVLMPVMRGAEYLEETLQSVQGQTMQDWELLAVYASDLDAEKLETLQRYADKDKRILLQMSEGWGSQAEMMNLGLENAQGEYVARAEVGAVFAADRLEKQLDFLEAHPEVSFCSSSVNMVNTEGTSSLRKAICDEAELRASMIFGCEINHQSVMLRKADFDNKNLRYDPEWLSEYELWGRAMLEGLLMANLPEALVSCYAQSNGMDMGTRERLHAETRQLVMRNVSALGIDIADYSPTLFAGWRNRPEGFAKKHPVNFLKGGYLLLQEIAEANKEKHMFDEVALEKVLYKRWDWVRKSCGLDFVAGQYGKFAEVREPKVSIVMPVGKCAGTLSRAIDSLQAQTLNEWELFLMQVAGQEDGSSEIAAMYAKNDPRISYLPMEEERNEAEAMNEGFGMATGKYIARMAADVVAVPERLEKQSAYLDEHEEVVICGGWQRINDAHGERIQKTADDNDVLKARLMFYGDMIPETLMLRKELLKDGLAYDTEAQDIDYVFLAKASLCGDVANLPVVLVTREGSANTQKNLALAAEESGKVAAQVLEQALGVSVSHSSQKLLNDWVNPLGKAQDWKREQEISRFSSILQDIWRANEEKQYYAPKALLDVLARKWCQVRHDIDWQHLDTSHIENLEEIFADEFKPQLTMPYHIFRKEKEAGEWRIPKVTALMPLFNGKKYIRESIESIQAQTFTDWEFYIVNDFGSDDGCAEIVMEYAMQDERIVLVQAERRLGLAASLNLGLSLIHSEYVARVDVDDPSERERFAKQVEYMNGNPHVDLCSVWQYSLTPNGSNLQVVAHEADELKAAMMFGCEISHCGVMLRKESFDAHGWRYDPSFLGEDYELWTRAMMEGAVMVNLPEPLVTHRWGYGNISLDKGESLRQEVRKLSMRMISSLGVNTEKYDAALFAGWRNRPDSYARKNKELFLKHGYKLLQEIWRKNFESKFFVPEALKKVLYQRWDWVRKSCGLKYEENKFGIFNDIEVTPIVSVVMPTFRSAEYICQAIDSVQAQTFTDWEMLIVNDFSSDDGIVELVQMYSLNDSRIHLVQAQERLGLAESLNLGMRVAKGKYIARLDADDISYPERFEKQVAFLEENSNVGICGSWQRHYGGRNWIHKAAPEPEVQRARLIFWCDLCHSTLMLRRAAFIDNNLFYDGNAQAEDFDLWSRAISYMDVANIPEVLGDYNEGTGITSGKIADLAEESGRISARTLEQCLGLSLSIYDYNLLNGWRNPISKLNKTDDLNRVQNIMRRIWKSNEEIGFFDSKCLLEVLAAKYFWLKDNKDWKKEDYSYICDLEEIFKDKEESVNEGEEVDVVKNDIVPSWATKICKEIDKRIEVWTWERYRRIENQVFKRIDKQIERWTWERYKRIEDNVFKKIDKQIERWTWERYQRLQDDLENNIGVTMIRNNLVATDYIPYEGGKVRVLFLFQMASFWPSWESLYESCMNDDRVEVMFCLLDEQYGDTDQMHTNKTFLEEKNIPYVIYKDELLEKVQPHVVFLQTPYDKYHRSQHVRSAALRNFGSRVVYITYGIELADTESAHYDHFVQDVILNSWRIYTFSERMRLDYRIYSVNGRAVLCCGHPKFDGLYHKDSLSIPNEYRDKIKGRKLILWHVHFPKRIIDSDGKTKFVTPYISEYEKFIKAIRDNEDMFFCFLPHPKFVYSEVMKKEVNNIMKSLSLLENCYIDMSDDYRGSLANADAVISDRSALLIEAGALDVPVLYMSNADFYEPMTEAVRPLVESYEQGSNCEDMIGFIERCRLGIDKNKELREKAFNQCIPHFDGRCGDRIKESILSGIKEEG